ncbi:somatostatin receptor type 3-like [Lytechinus variegatus]|uniref:somatostatin receptor type 3-like n=1 Tax=Lytechinus variegatus TaxID=7654 RepID=UPI001BB15510|nr:somatostatin receptor type 3-like [Lytechinus variegatus]
MSEKTALSDVTISTVYTVMGLLGVIGNTLVLVVIIVVRDLHDVANVLIGNQSLIDLLTSLLLLASFVAPLPSIPTNNPILARFLCAFWHSKYPFWSLIVASSLNLTLMTLERYYALVFPLHYHSRTKSTKLACLVALPWLSGFAYQQYLAWFSKVEQNQCHLFLFPNIASRTGLTFGATILELFLPTIVIIYVYIAVYIRLKITMTEQFKDSGKSGGSQVTSSDTSAPNTNSRIRARRNVLKMMLIVSACFVICWLPNQIIYWLYVFGLNIDLTGLIYTLSVFIAFGNMWINPFIYSFQYRRFQKGLRQVFCRWKRGKEAKRSTTTPSTISLAV